MRSRCGSCFSWQLKSWAFWTGGLSTPCMCICLDPPPCCGTLPAGHFDPPARPQPSTVLQIEAERAAVLAEERGNIERLLTAISGTLNRDLPARLQVG